MCVWVWVCVCVCGVWCVGVGGCGVHIWECGWVCASVQSQILYFQSSRSHLHSYVPSAQTTERREQQSRACPLRGQQHVGRNSEYVNNS